MFDAGYHTLDELKADYFIGDETKKHSFFIANKNKNKKTFHFFYASGYKNKHVNEEVSMEDVYVFGYNSASDKYFYMLESEHYEVHTVMSAWIAAENKKDWKKT